VASEDPLDRIAGELEEERAPLTARRAQLEAEIADLFKREQRIDAALAGLRTGRPSGAGGAKKPTAGSKDWVPSQKTLDEVYAAIARADKDGDGPLTMTQIVDRVHVSRATVEKVLRYLRSEQKIRIVGTAPSPGAPKTYGPMP
jgi:hypothetical protein